MNKLNNKGFAITTVVYGITILIVLLSFTVIKVTRTTYSNKKDLVNDVKSELENKFNFYIVSGQGCTIDDIGCEVVIGIEHFYVIGDDTENEGNVLLLAKYNLDTSDSENVIQSDSSASLFKCDDDYLSIEYKGWNIELFKLDDDINSDYITENYWLKSQNDNAYCIKIDDEYVTIDKDGNISEYDIINGEAKYGFRPVISVSKTLFN